MSVRLGWGHATTVTNGDCGTIVTRVNRKHNRVDDQPIEIA